MTDTRNPDDIELGELLNKSDDEIQSMFVESEDDADEIDDGDDTGSKAEDDAGADDGGDEPDGEELQDGNDEEDQDDSKTAETEKEELTPADYARLRREKRALENQVKKQEQATGEKAEDVKDNSDPEPNAKDNPYEHLAWQNRQLQKQLSEVTEYVNQDKQQKSQQATIEDIRTNLMTAEADFKKTVDDYDDVSASFRTNVIRSYHLLNPTANPQDIVKAADEHILGLAQNFEAQGFDPVEELYELAKENYVPVKKMEEPKKRSESERLKTIEKNKKKSLNNLGATGATGKRERTLQDVDDISIGELEKLDVDAIMARERG